MPVFPNVEENVEKGFDNLGWDIDSTYIIIVRLPTFIYVYSSNTHNLHIHRVITHGYAGMGFGGYEYG
jgi:hypothetical protein